MAITNKKLSADFIRGSGLNTVAEKEFSIRDSKNILNDVRSFLDKYSCELYNMRDRSNIASPYFIYGIDKAGVMSNVLNFCDKFTVFESLRKFDCSNLILQGEISIDSNMGVLASLDCRKGIPNRVAMLNPMYNLKFSLMEKREPTLSGLSFVINYIFEHNLLDLIVEFSLYDVALGVNKENIIIWEVRSY